MPIYQYECDNEDCGAGFEYNVSIARRDELVGHKCEACDPGKFIRVPTAVRANGFTTSESLGYKKAPEEFRNLLSTIKKNHPGSVIPER